MHFWYVSVKSLGALTDNIAQIYRLFIVWARNVLITIPAVCLCIALLGECEHVEACIQTEAGEPV